MLVVHYIHEQRNKATHKKDYKMSGYMVAREDGKVKVGREWVTPTEDICENNAMVSRKGAENYLADNIKAEPTARIIEVSSAYVAALEVTASSKKIESMMAFGEDF